MRRSQYTRRANVRMQRGHACVDDITRAGGVCSNQSWEDSSHHNTTSPCRYIHRQVRTRAYATHCPHVSESVRCVWDVWCVSCRCCAGVCVLLSSVELCGTGVPPVRVCITNPNPNPNPNPNLRVRANPNPNPNPNIPATRRWGRRARRAPSVGTAAARAGAACPCRPSDAADCPPPSYAGYADGS